MTELKRDFMEAQIEGSKSSAVNMVGWEEGGCDFETACSENAMVYNQTYTSEAAAITPLYVSSTNSSVENRNFSDEPIFKTDSEITGSEAQLQYEDSARPSQINLESQKLGGPYETSSHYNYATGGYSDSKQYYDLGKDGNYVGSASGYLNYNGGVFTTGGGLHPDGNTSINTFQNFSEPLAGQILQKEVSSTCINVPAYASTKSKDNFDMSIQPYIANPHVPNQNHVTGIASQDVEQFLITQMKTRIVLDQRQTHALPLGMGGFSPHNQYNQITFNQGIPSNDVITGIQMSSMTTFPAQYNSFAPQLHNPQFIHSKQNNVSLDPPNGAVETPNDNVGEPTPTTASLEVKVKDTPPGDVSGQTVEAETTINDNSSEYSWGRNVTGSLVHHSGTQDSTATTRSQYGCALPSDVYRQPEANGTYPHAIKDHLVFQGQYSTAPPDNAFEYCGSSHIYSNHEGWVKGGFSNPTFQGVPTIQSTVNISHLKYPYMQTTGYIPIAHCNGAGNSTENGVDISIEKLSQENTVTPNLTQTQNIGNKIPMRRRRRIREACTNVRSKDAEKRPFACTFPKCNKRYFKEANLSLHLKKHSGERPYGCTFDNCGRRFKRSDQLKRHFRKHTGERPYSCVICGRKFARSDHLKTHNQTHLAKPHLCRFLNCKKKFSQVEDLRRHESTHMRQSSHKKNLAQNVIVQLPSDDDKTYYPPPSNGQYLNHFQQVNLVSQTAGFQQENRV